MKNQLDRARVEPMPSSTWIENHTIKPTADKRSMPLLWFRARSVGRSLAELLCQLNIKPPWPNGQGAPLLRVRLWVRVPLGVFEFFFLVSISKKRYPVWDKSILGRLWLYWNFESFFWSMPRPSGNILTARWQLLWRFGSTCFIIKYWKTSSTRIEYVPALCTHRPSLLPIGWVGEWIGEKLLSFRKIGVLF